MGQIGPFLFGAVAFCLGVATFPWLISRLAAWHVGQRVHAYSPATHAAKQGIPTMGGIGFVWVPILGFIFLAHSASGFAVFFCMVAGLVIGLLDDISNVRGKGQLGLLARQKLVLQLVAGLVAGAFLLRVGISQQYVPGAGLVEFGGWTVLIGTAALVGATNGVNLTDGLDGLAGSTGAVALAVLCWIAVAEGNLQVALIGLGVLGGLLAFLLFNWSPARLFMGDSGALALGGVIAGMALVLGVVWLLPLLGIVFVIEVLSVAINVTAVVRFHRHLLRSSPLHHHFEELKYSETTIVRGFIGLGLAGAIATVLLVWPVVYSIR